MDKLIAYGLIHGSKGQQWFLLAYVRRPWVFTGVQYWNCFGSLQVRTTLEASLFSQRVLFFLAYARVVLRIFGSGFFAQFGPTTVCLATGYSHSLTYVLPKAIIGFARGRKRRLLTFSGLQRSALLNLVEQIRRVCPPNIYTQKGLRYRFQVLRRLVGKKKFV